MSDIYPVEVWPSDADVAQLDGVTDEATGLPYIARGTGPTSDPPLEIQYNRAQQRLKQIVGVWNQGRIVDEGAGRIGVYPIRYWMDGVMQAFEGASGVSVPAEGTWMVYVDRDGVLQISLVWPESMVSYLPLGEVTLHSGVLSICDARTYAAFRAGRDAALWPLAVNLSIAVAVEVAGAIDITIRAVDAAGEPVAGMFEVHAWLSDAADSGAVTSLAPDGGGSVIVGVLLATEEAGKRWRLVTDGSGQIVLRVVHSGAHSWYLHSQIGGRVISSGVIAFV